MPHIPSFRADNRLIGLRVVGGAPDLASAPFRQWQQFGQAAQSLGQAGMQIATDMAVEANRVQVMAAQNRAMGAMNELANGGPEDAGFYSLRGEAALQKLDELPLPDAYGEKLRKRLAEIEDGLGNDAQKQAFAIWRGAKETEFRDQVQRHMMGEFRQHQKSTYQGAVELGINEAQTVWADEARVRNAIEGLPVPGGGDTRYGGVRQAAYQLAKAQGKSEMEAAYDVKKAVSAAHMGVVQQALSARDPGYARKYVDRYKGDMLENDLLKTNAHLSQHLDSTLAMAAVQATTRDYANRFQPTDMDRLTGIVLGLESGGKDFDGGGQPTTSKRGALYAMQVMPATAKAPGFGIRPAADDSPEEYNRVGKEYLGALVKKYGNVGHVLAAYNAGPGALDEAIQKAKKEGRPSAWAGYLPEETRRYVKDGLAKFSTGQGTPVLPTEMEFTQAAVARLGPDASTEAMKLARIAAEHQFKAIERSVKDREDRAVADGMRWLEANGGRFSEMPDNLKSGIPPKEWDNLRTYGKTVASGDNITNLALYEKLATDQAYLKKLPDDAFYRLRTELSEADFKHFANERAGLKSGKANSAEDLNTSAINSVLNDRLRVLGEDPTPKDGSSDAARVGALRQFVRRSVLNEQSVTGKKMTDLEVEKHIDGLFAKSVKFQTTFLGITTGRTQMPLLGMNPGDIPGEVANRLRADFRARGVSEPTDAELLGAYWILKSTRR